MATTYIHLKKIIRRRIEWQKMEIGELVKLQDELMGSYEETAVIIKRIHDRVHGKGTQSVTDDPKKIAEILVRAIDLSLEQLGFFLEYAKNVNSLDEDEATDSALKEERKASLKKHIQLVQKLLKGLHRCLAALEKKEKSIPFVSTPQFIVNNKLPSPDEEEPKRVRLPLSMAEDLAYSLNLLDKEMAQILTISIRTYHRLKQSGLLNPVASERLIMLKDLADYGLEVFENQDSFNQWLRLPLQELSNNSPLNSLNTATGFNQVKTILSRIDYGVYS